MVPSAMSAGSWKKEKMSSFFNSIVPYSRWSHCSAGSKNIRFHRPKRLAPASRAGIWDTEAPIIYIEIEGRIWASEINRNILHLIVDKDPYPRQLISADKMHKTCENLGLIQWQNVWRVLCRQQRLRTAEDGLCVYFSTSFRTCMAQGAQVEEVTFSTVSENTHW